MLLNPRYPSLLSNMPNNVTNMKQIASGGSCDIYYNHGTDEVYKIMCNTDDNKTQFFSEFNAAQRIAEFYAKHAQTGVDVPSTLSHIVSHINFFQPNDPNHNHPDHFGIIMKPITGMELYDYIIDSESHCRSIIHIGYIFHQLLQALDCIHSLGIIHRDIKPENIMIDPNNLHIILIDFGLSYTFCHDTDPINPTQQCGSSFYVAPEILYMSPLGYDSKVDMWAAGVILYIMLTREFPFDKIGESEETQTLNYDDYWIKNLNKNYTNSDYSPLIDLIKNLLVVDPKKRFCAKQALSHEFMVKIREYIYSKSD